MMTVVNIAGITIALILAGFLRQVRSDAINHKYKEGDPITMYANKVGPFHNPSETYAYYTLPFCPPDSLSEKKLSLGEILNGDRLVAAYSLGFLVERSSEVLCRKNLTTEEVFHFRTAVARDYYLQLYFDDLPIWSFLGKVDREGKEKVDEYTYFIYTHVDFEIFYNGNHLIEIYLRTDPSSVIDITKDKAIDVGFYYTVRWKETDIAFEDRLQKYTMSAILPHHLSVHWFSITNSFLTVLVLIGCLVGLYVCVLQRDFYKDANDEELADNENESGWKILHADVFRYPKYKSVLAAAIGSGVQLFTVTLCILLLGYIGVFRPYDRGDMKTALVFSYAATTGVAGLSAAMFYNLLEGTNWVRNLSLTTCLSCGTLFLAFAILNSVAAMCGTTAALPLGTITMIFLGWLIVSLPLLFLGGTIGKLMSSKFQAPCRTRDCPREVPTLRCYRGLLPQMLLGGLLPFGVIFTQVYYIFASVWGHRIFTLYGVLLVVFILFVITTALVSVGLTYFQLAAEDHHWWWRSFLCAGSTGLYLFAYCWYYFMERSDMDSLMQVSFFFGYMAWVCYGLFLMSGTVGFGASFLFVRYIYSNIKCD